jgi:6-phosphogluconolactonase
MDCARHETFARGLMMKSRILAGISLASLVCLAGCKGFWDLPTSTGTGGTTPTTLSSGVFYVLNQTTKQIAGFVISSGTLDKITGSPYALSAAPTSIAVAPSAGFLYVGTVNGIYLYSIGSGGALSLQNSGNPISTDIPTAMLVSGSWLVDVFSNASNSAQLDAIPIDSTSGAYTGSGGVPPNQTFNIAKAAVNGMVLSPDGANLFVALGLGGTIVVPFTSGNANPLGATALTIPLANAGGSAQSVAVDPFNRVFYIGETLANTGATSGGLRVFNYSSLGSGTPTQATGSPIASGGLSPNSILPNATGEYVYVANGTGTTEAGNIAWFPITASGTTYTVAAGSTITSGINPIGLAEDSQSNFALAVSTGGSTMSGNPDLEAYVISTSSGALTSAIQSATGTDAVGAVAVAALP